MKRDVCKSLCVKCSCLIYYLYLFYKLHECGSELVDAYDHFQFHQLMFRRVLQRFQLTRKYDELKSITCFCVPLLKMS